MLISYKIILHYMQERNGVRNQIRPIWRLSIGSLHKLAPVITNLLQLVAFTPAIFLDSAEFTFQPAVLIVRAIKAG